MADYWSSSIILVAKEPTRTSEIQSTMTKGLPAAISTPTQSIYTYIKTKATTTKVTVSVSPQAALDLTASYNSASCWKPSSVI